MTSQTYRQTINAWRRERDEIIRRENGWLSLSGLYWLKLGKNQVGSDPKSEIQLPERVPANIGHLEYNGRSVTFRAAPGQNIQVNDKQTDFAILQPDISETPSYIRREDIQLVVIQRGNRMGVRMWDNQREERRSFPARSWFDIDEKFRIPATFTPYDRPKIAFFRISPEKNPSFPSKDIYLLNSAKIIINWTSTKRTTARSSSAFGTPPVKMRATPPAAT